MYFIEVSHHDVRIPSRKKVRERIAVSGLVFMTTHYKDKDHDHSYK